MQKKQYKGSILIWSIFLSLILSISFISISNKITQKLGKNKNFVAKNLFNNKINRKIKKKDYSNEIFSLSDEKIIFIQNKNFKGSLKKEESKKVKLVENSNISINIIDGGPLFYTTSGSLTSSGIITSNTGFTISGSIILNNLGGYTKYTIDSDKNFIPPEIIYNIIKKIGNKNIIKNRGIIKNNLEM